jgi:hypothetical protein
MNWLAEHGGEVLSPGLTHGGEVLSPAKVVPETAIMRHIAKPNLLRLCMGFSLSGKLAFEFGKLAFERSSAGNIKSATATWAS